MQLVYGDWCGSSLVLYVAIRELSCQKHCQGQWRCSKKCLYFLVHRPVILSIHSSDQVTETVRKDKWWLFPEGDIDMSKIVLHEKSMQGFKKDRKETLDGLTYWWKIKRKGSHQREDVSRWTEAKRTFCSPPQWHTTVVCGTSSAAARGVSTLKKKCSPSRFENSQDYV